MRVGGRVLRACVVGAALLASACTHLQATIDDLQPPPAPARAEAPLPGTYRVSTPGIAERSMVLVGELRAVGATREGTKFTVTIPYGDTLRKSLEAGVRSTVEAVQPEAGENAALIEIRLLSAGGSINYSGNLSSYRQSASAYMNFDVEIVLRDRLGRETKKAVGVNTPGYYSSSFSGAYFAIRGAAKDATEKAIAALTAKVMEEVAVLSQRTVELR